MLKRAKYDNSDFYFEEGAKNPKSSDQIQLFDANKLTPKNLEGESILAREEKTMQSNKKKRVGRYLFDD